MVKDRSEIWWARANTCITVDAFRHIYVHGGVRPFGVTFTLFDSLQSRWTVPRCHLENSTGLLSFQIGN